MNRISLFLFLISNLACSAAVSDELCLDNGTPKSGYQPVASDYFGTPPTTGGFTLLGKAGPAQLNLLNLDTDRTPKSGYQPVASDYFGTPPTTGGFTLLGKAGPAQLNLLNLDTDGGITSKSVPHFVISPNRHGPFVKWAGVNGPLELKGRKQRIIQLLDFNKRVVYPPPPGSAGDLGRSAPLSEWEKSALTKCRKAVPAAEDLRLDSDPGMVSAQEACTLLQFEKNCLTQDERPPAFANDAYKSVIVGITSSSGLPYCMGTLVHGNGEFRLITSRHCFIDRSSGKADALLKLRTGETLDRKRLISIDENDIKRLELPCQGNCELPKGAYGPEKDAVSLRVSVSELIGAPKLPIVKMDSAVKGCITDTSQDLGGNCTRVWTLGVVPDLLAAKRLEAQATKVAVSGSWVDEVRWSRWFGGYTRIDFLEENCAYYTSQTMGGFSGTPLFTRAETMNGQDILYIAGVHSGATSADKRAWPACNTKRKNPSPDRLDLNIADLQVDAP